MLQGGYSTLSAAVGNAVAVLLARPEALERMRDAALLTTGVDELVRFDGPVQGTTRVAVRACRIGGAEIAAGQKAVPLFTAANRDPDAFPGAGPAGAGPHAEPVRQATRFGVEALGSLNPPRDVTTSSAARSATASTCQPGSRIRSTHARELNPALKSVLVCLAAWCTRF
ncbi:hypothetical protein [Streptomyces sp. PBH53]|uniref:hypothetical protein n=2 Tax=Streptomyces TaxID=1883 RepID=UPI001AD80738|nr:hypothetical protein [Streptomyces sp. PBH53]